MSNLPALSEKKGILQDIAATEHLAQRLAAQLQVGDVLLLEGDLGVGKTAFSRALITAMAGKDTDVISPTFMLLQTYESAQGTLYHYDFYRLKSANELTELGLQEALEQGITLIEWPALAEDFLPTHAWRLSLGFGDSSTARTYRLQGPQQKMANV